MGAGIDKLSHRQAFFVQGHCNLDLWSNDPLNHKGSSTGQTQLQVKFEGHGCRHCPIITWNIFAFKVTVNLTFDPMTPKINKGHLLVRPNFHVKFDDHRFRHCWDITGRRFVNFFALKVTVTLTLAWWPPKSRGVIYWSGPTFMSSLMTIGPGIVEFAFKVTVTLTFDP